MEFQEEYRFESIVLVVWCVFAVTLFLGEAGFSVPLIRPVIAIPFLTFGLGGLFLQALGIKPGLRWTWCIYAVGCGMMIVTVVGVFLNTLLPLVGYRTPLLAVPLLFGISLITSGLIFYNLRYSTDSTVPVPDRQRFSGALTNAKGDGWQISLALSLPFFAFLATRHLNTANNTLPVTALLVFFAGVPVLAVLGCIDDRYLPVTLWGTSLGVLYHKSLFIGHLFGGHASVVTVWKSGYWPQQHETLAVNGVTMPAFAQLSGVHVLTQVEVVMPLFVSVLPLALFLTFRRYTDPTMAFLGTLLFVFSHPFYYQYPSVPRASIPVLFLALLGTTMSDDYHNSFALRVLASLFGVGVVVSHYGTSYYVMFAFMGALVVISLFSTLEYVLRQPWPRTALDQIGLDTYSDTEVSTLPYSRIFDKEFVTFYISAAIIWYFYIAGGSKYRSLVNHVANAFQSLFYETGGQGATATRLQTDYGGLAIQYSKYLYLLFAFLIGIGIALVVLRRIVPTWKTQFDDGYLGVASCIFALFGATFVISGEWGGGRPMMIALSFTSIFAVIAVVDLGQAVSEATMRTLERLSLPDYIETGTVSPSMPGESGWAIVLATFFLLNSGVMSALAYGGEAPSNVPTADAREADTTEDLQTHAWLADHRNLSRQIYGDREARAQTTDWMNGEIAIRSERTPYRFKKKYFFSALNDSALETGYVLMMKHNVEDDRVEVNYITARPIEEYQLHLEERNRVYTNGASRVYYTDTSTRLIYEERREETEGTLPP